MKSAYHQKLPHYQSAGAEYFLTYRLFGSVPADVITNTMLQHVAAMNKIAVNLTSDNEKKLLQTKLLREYALFLGKVTNAPHWLRNESVAGIVYDSLIFLNKSKIDLRCFTIMSNHVHAMFTLKNYKDDLFRIMQSHKSFTATQCNKLLQRSGKFWELESYDHSIRPGEHENIYNYIIQNPVKAGLVKHWRDWKWTFVR